MTDAALGHLMLRLTDAKRRRATLMSDLAQQGVTLWDFGHHLRQVREILVLNDDTLPKFPEGYPDPRQLRAMLDDLRTVCQDIALANTQLADAGIDVS